MLNVELRTRRSSLRVHALVRVDADEMPAEDESEQAGQALSMASRAIAMNSDIQVRSLPRGADEAG